MSRLEMLAGKSGTLPNLKAKMSRLEMLDGARQILECRKYGGFPGNPGMSAFGLNPWLIAVIPPGCNTLNPEGSQLLAGG
jgi:hypothetical protein